MRLHEIRELLSFRRPVLPGGIGRLDACYDVNDLRSAAKRVLPGLVFDYLEGGADEEVTLRRNVNAFREWEFRPRSLTDVETVDLSATLLGRTLTAPLVLAPTGYSRLMHPAGEIAVARSAKAAGVPYTLSTVASTSLEDVAATGHDNLWFQLYVWRDRGLTSELVTRAWESGYRVLELTVDTPVAGRRTRDVRNGLTIPPNLTPRALAGAAVKPGYWTRLVRSPALTFGNLSAAPEARGLTIADVAALFDPTVGWDDVERLRADWKGQLLLKGPITTEVARRAQALGVDGLQLSNHGGRQLDRLPAPIDTVVEIRAAVGDELTIVVDSGIRHGADVAVAVACGADAGAVGRAYLYGLAAAGEPGVGRAISLLLEQLRRTLQLVGVASIRELRAQGVEVVKRRA